jgi:hypothetical protein
VNSQNKISIQETGGVAQVVEHLLSKLRGTLHQKKKKKQKPKPSSTKEGGKKKIGSKEVSEWMTKFETEPSTVELPSGV